MNELSRQRRLLSCVFMVGLPPSLGYLSVRIIATAWPLASGIGIFFQITNLLIGILVLALAVWMAVIPIRRKVRTGRFFPTSAEIAKERAKAWDKLGAGRPLAPQIWLWLIPVLVSAAFVALGIGAMALAACGCGHTRWAGGALFVLAAVIFCLGLVYPFVAIRRKLRTGSFLPSQEEFAKLRARCGKPLTFRQRLTAAIAWFLIALVWTWSIVSHHHAYSGTFPPWLVVVLSWICAAIYTWQLFRPSVPSCALPSDALPPEDSGSGAPQTQR